VAAMTAERAAWMEEGQHAEAGAEHVRLAEAALEEARMSQQRLQAQLEEERASRSELQRELRAKQAEVAELEQRRCDLESKLEARRAKSAPSVSFKRERQIKRGAFSAIDEDLRQIELKLRSLTQQREAIARQLYEHEQGQRAVSAHASLGDLHSQQVEALLAQLSLRSGQGATLGGWSQPHPLPPRRHAPDEPDDAASEASYFTSRWLPAGIS